MTAVLNLDDVLALLEEQPLDSPALAAFLELPVDLVHKSLCAAERVHTVKRVGIRQLWARPDYVAPVGRRPDVSLDACRAAILAAVRRGPKPMQLLVAETGYPRNTLKHLTEQMRQAGQIKLAGNARGSFWVTPSWTPPSSGPKGGRPAWVDHAARQRVILAAVAKGPTSIHTIAAALGLNGSATSEECRRVAKTGAIKIVTLGGLQPRKLWALASWEPAETPKPARSTLLDQEIARRVRATDVVDEPLDPIDAPAFEDDDPSTVPDDTAETWSPPLRKPVTPAIRTATTQGTKLRQAKPVAVPKDAKPSWWVGAPPAGFTSTAVSHQERMRASKESFQVGLRLLQ